MHTMLHSKTNLLQIVTISQDDCACVWNTKDGSKCTDVKWPYSAEDHKFRSCRLVNFPRICNILRKNL